MVYEIFEIYFSNFSHIKLVCTRNKRVKPNYIFEATGGVTNLVIQNNLLLASTTASSGYFDIEKRVDNQ